MRYMALAIWITFATIGCGAIQTLPSTPSTSPPPDPQKKLVGTAVCPNLNAGEGKACRIDRKGHGFQVWPERILVVADPQPGIWLVTWTLHEDLMFDHTMKAVYDDHIAFKCYIRPGDGSYWGPFDFALKSGGFWTTYGFGIKAASSGTLGGILGGSAGGPWGPIGSAIGGAGAEGVGLLIQKNRDKSWQAQAITVAHEICGFMAAPAAPPSRPGSLTIH